MKSTWNIDKGYQPPFDRLCQKVEEQEKTIKELNERINALESAPKKDFNSIALDWLVIFTVVSVVFCWVIIPAFGLWFK